MSLRRLFAALSAAVGGSQRRRVITAASGTGPPSGSPSGCSSRCPAARRPRNRSRTWRWHRPSQRPRSRDRGSRLPRRSPASPSRSLGPGAGREDRQHRLRRGHRPGSPVGQHRLRAAGGRRPGPGLLEAVFSSHVPKVIGPVRSAREDDLELLKQFGRPAFAFSGAAPHLLPFIERARIVTCTPGRWRLLPRRQPHRPVQPVRGDTKRY